MRRTDGVLGAWNFGSAMHGTADEYSDADVCFLIKGDYFRQTEQLLQSLLSKVCEKVILCREESFNRNAVINNGYLLKKENRILQFDVFLLNQDMPDDFMCKIHYTEQLTADAFAARTCRTYVPHICLQLFRHITQKAFDIRRYACKLFMRSAEKSDGASVRQ